MQIWVLVTLVAALGSGLVAGVFFAFSTFVMPGLSRLPPAEGVAAMQAINVAAINRWFMGLLFGTAALCVVVVVASLPARAELGAKLRIGGAGLYVLSAIAITMVFNVPENVRLARLVPTGSGAREAWHAFLSTWCPFNHLRAGGSLVATILLMLALFGITGCGADPVRPLPAPGSTRPAARLSELGLFEGAVSEQTPKAGVTPYDVNAALFSDHATKRRFMFLPPGASLTRTADRFELPVGGYLVKTFSFPIDARDPKLGERRIETRILMQTERGLIGSTYLWAPDQKDAFASSGDVAVPVSWIDERGARREEKYRVPGTSSCDGCHAGRPLGLSARQLEQGEGHLVDPFGSAPLADRARSYLDTNCSHCHGQGGSAEDTRLLLDTPHAAGARLPCDKMLTRLNAPFKFLRMPRGPAEQVDEKGIELLRTWFATAKPCAS